MARYPVGAGKFIFVVLAVAVGVGALTGVRSFSRAFHNLLVSQARTLMAGDLSLRVFEQPTARTDGNSGGTRKTRSPRDNHYRDADDGEHA